MNMETLKPLIVEMREKEGMTFQAIADHISEEYGVVRTRQGIQSIYKRAVKEMNDPLKKDEYLFEADVKNLYALGYFITEIEVELAGVYPNAVYNRIRKVVNDAALEIGTIQEGILGQVKVLMSHSHFYKELEGQIKYKEWEIQDRALRKYIRNAFRDRIVSKVQEELRNLEGFMGDSSEVSLLRSELKEVEF